MKGLLSVNKWKLLKFLAVRMTLNLNEFMFPWIISEMIAWIQTREDEPLEKTVRMVAFGLLIPLLRVLAHTIWEYFCFQMIEVGHRAHTALKVMLFRKNFKMTSATNKDFSSGEINNIVMNESNRIWSFIWEGPAYFECAFHLITASVIVFYQIGYCGFLVLFFTLARSLLEYIRGKTETAIGEKQRGKREQRSLYINESFSNIKTVKLFGWEPDFLKKVDEVFQEELDIEDKQHARAKIYDVLNHFLHSIASFTIFGVYIWLGNTLTLSKLALTEIMLGRIRDRINHTQHLYRQYFSVMESMQKLWEFYCAPESQKGLIERNEVSADDTNALTIKGNFSYGITPKLDQAEKDKIREKIKKKEHEKATKDMGRVRKAIFEMTRDSKYKPAIPLKDRNLEQIISLKDLDIKVKKGSFTVIIGATGSGKSTLLNAMIGELIFMPEQAIKEIGDYQRPIKEGEMRYLEDALLATDLSAKSPISVHGSTSFCEQQAWIQNGKLRENVLFGTDFDKKKYVETIMACQLEPDLAIMPAGDATEIGEKGINLSGGQKARVALARAVYKRPDVLIMDDPISALDAHVRKAIFDQVFVGLMKDKTRVLVTHAVEFIHLADQVVIMKDGRVEAQGSYEELQSHPYMMEVQEIHTKNKREIEQANMEDALEEITFTRKAKSTMPKMDSSGMGSPTQFVRRLSVANYDSRQPTQSSETSSRRGTSTPALRKAQSVVSESVMELDLDEKQVEAKLEEFRGINREVDGKTSQIVGKLLKDEADEDVNADDDTYNKLIALVGGPIPVILFACYAQFQKYWDNNV
mmetsp:Transcript_36652/g.48120  ORF Transcript_36652/g.48120 Transcript_36652/m.48120 type:complete len:809 (+) Transcript_36652:302-2728(+)